MSAENRSWAQEQFEGAALGDVRRVDRATFIASRLLESPGSSIP
ncbi:MAG: transposase DNA-binding-containing protein, partial [Gemmatimonadota bacterium]